MSSSPIITAVVVQPPPSTSTTSTSSSSSSSNVPFNSVTSKQQHTKCSGADGDRGISIETTSSKAAATTTTYEVQHLTALQAFSNSSSTSISYDSEEEERNRQLIPASEDSALGADSYDDCDPMDEHATSTVQNVLYSSSLGTSSSSQQQQSSSLSVSTIQSIINDNSTSRNPLETATASSLPKTILLSTTATSAVVTSNHHPISTSSEDHVIPPLTSSPSSSFASMSAERTSAAAIVQHSKSLTKSSFGAHSHRHHHHHQQPSVDWSSASAKSSTSTAISPSFRSKSVSTSSTSSSGCGEDLDQLVNSPEGDHSGDHDHHHHHHHDSSPDSPDSGVSSSANSADDLKNNEGDEEEEETMHQHQREASSVEVASAVNSRSASLRSSHHCSSVSTSLTISSGAVQRQIVQQTVSTVSSLKVTKKSSGTSSVEASNSSVEVSELKAAIQVEAACKWHKCDWPGSYEELEDHIQDLHITLQPYYDENGKVIRWTKPPKRSAQLRANFAAATGADETDETPCNSEPEAEGSDDEQAGQSDDDDRSMSSASSMRITRRTGRLLADYSASGSSKQQQHQQKMTRQQSLGNSSSNNNNNSSTKDSKQTSSGMEFVCLWKGCRVYGVQSSKQWLERHVREYHMGPHLHKCILAGCTRRFKTQNALQKHLETAHFSNNQSGSGTGNGGGGSGLNQQHHPEHHHHHHHHNFYHLQQHHNFDQLYSIFGEGSRAQHAKQKICCACACHAKCMCFICDSEHAPSATTTTTVTPTTTVNHHPAEQQQQHKEKEQQRSLRHRPSTTVRDGQPLKNRCESTDSAISLNSHASSATAEHCLPPSTSTSTSISSLSSSSSAASSSSSCSSEHQQHSTNCCKQYAEFGPNAAFLKNRKKLLKRKKFFTPLPKPNIKFDFFGDQAAAMAIYAARRRRMQAAGIKYIYRMMERTEDGTFVEANLKTALKVKSSSEKDEYKEYMSEDSSNDSDEGSDEEREEKKVKNEPEKKRRIYYCMDERLFSEYITFTTKIIGTKKSSSGETKLQLQWHPKGFYEDEWIKKCDLEFYRSRTVPRSVLPKSFLQALDEAQSSASQAAASVSNGKSTVSKNTTNKSIIKAKNLGSNKSTAKRSHSLNRNGRTAALGAEESESDDGAAANTAASPPQRPKRLRRQP